MRHDAVNLWKRSTYAAHNIETADTANIPHLISDAVSLSDTSTVQHASQVVSREGDRKQQANLRRA